MTPGSDRLWARARLGPSRGAGCSSSDITESPSWFLITGPLWPQAGEQSLSLPTADQLGGGWELGARLGLSSLVTAEHRPSWYRHPSGAWTGSLGLRVTGSVWGCPYTPPIQSALVSVQDRTVSQWGQLAGGTG